MVCVKNMVKKISNIRKWGFKKTLLIAETVLTKKIFVFKENFLNKSADKRTYSQYAEDIFIDRFLGYPKNGFYVDVGANQPDHLNNTKRFYEKGWHGINIEPDLNNFRLLEKARPEDTNLNVGISDQESVLIFYVCEEDTLSTFSKETAEKLASEGHRIIAEKEVSVIKLYSVLEKFATSEIDFMTIDTEGFDDEVLASNDWTKFRPRLICIEDNDKGHHDSFFKSINYKKVGHNGLNSFFARKE